ncbi:MAG: prephenate dehydrogenase [Thaumarchaeota archaeon]|nr:prephenate dehydrogenase [Nitrososphaerota archaeon]MDD9809033.1 prephenate dehydrogenase [Nitrososphaerota archaeon]MDD9812815.1 prephenate dehydrogenase [Nitrososphaerota archaeon]MDD9826089.1 prephenate dehydrogenase [Nitrososphaerota archaeon]MDD9843098.1 prephenate dehydrogenase [Nitrososphaerota archaeon]
MKKRVSVIGAAGQMGTWMCRYFAPKFDVTGYDEDESRPLPRGVEKGTSLVGAILKADYVVLCTPTRKTPEIIRLIAKEMRRDAHLIDISSQKLKTAASLSRVPAKIVPVCIHPMFGPGAKGTKGQNIISVPIRDAKKELALAKSLFPEATFVTIDSTEHDKRIAVILGLTHLVNIAFASIVSKDEKPSLTHKMSGSTFRIQKALSDSIMSETPELIDTIISNPQLRRIAEELWKDIGRLLTAVQENKSEEVTDYVKACQARIEANGGTAESYKKMIAMSRAMDKK